MMPDERYYLAPNDAIPTAWDIRDRQRLDAILVNGIAVRSLAAHILYALRTAWRHGAESVKNGEVII
jgi:hypothetical protein